MMGGMARVVSYDTPRTHEWKSFQFLKLLKKQINGILGGIDVASHTGFNLITSNIRNQFNASLEYGWNKI
jgi:hypothetical protein